MVCATSRPLSATLPKVYMAKMEDDTLENHQPKLYKRYVGDKINRHKKDQVGLLFNGFLIRTLSLH